MSQILTGESDNGTTVRALKHRKFRRKNREEERLSSFDQEKSSKRRRRDKSKGTVKTGNSRIVIAVAWICFLASGFVFTMSFSQTATEENDHTHQVPPRKPETTTSQAIHLGTSSATATKNVTSTTIGIDTIIKVAPEQWTDVGLDFDILLSGNQLLYHPAMRHCQERGGQLLELKSMEDQARVTALIQRDLSWSSYWIGINDFITDELFRYQSDNSPIAYDNWNENEPDNVGIIKEATNVIVSVFTREWADVSAFEVPHHFVCEKIQGLNYDWQSMAGLDLFYSFISMSLSDAKEFCQSHESRIFEPRSIRKSLEVRQKWRQYGYEEFWIGVSDAIVDGKFVYMSRAEKLAIQPQWTGNQSQGIEDGVVINSNGDWTYEPTDSSYPVVCERDQTGPLISGSIRIAYDICDDLTNNEQCGFDGGDCCIQSPNCNYCQECTCQLLEKRNCFLDECNFKQMTADLHCDDEANTAGCRYDGGDCCDPKVTCDPDRCTDCICHVTGKSLCYSVLYPECHDPARVHDEICQNDMFIEECGYDGGDCCFVDRGLVEYDWGRYAVDNQFIPLIGNGICDDVTNIEECVFDGGDCIQNGRDDCPGSENYGDGDCDASLNKEACGYDGGDCCQEFVDCVFIYQSTIVTYCEGDECNCHLTNQSHCDSWKREPIGDLGNCENYWLVGNSKCNDETNTAECQYDGGDCCITNTGVDCVDCEKCLCIAAEEPLCNDGFYNLLIDPSPHA